MALSKEVIKHQAWSVKLVFSLSVMMQLDQGI